MSLRSYADNPPSALVPTGLVVRPDHAVVPFSLTIEDLDPARAVAAMRTLLSVVDERIASHSARVLVRGVRAPHSEAKIGDGTTRTSLDGVVELDLPQAPPIDRALVLASLLGQLRALIGEGRRQKPAVAAAIGDPVALVRDPERHRGELVARWGKRLREIVDAATAAGATLAPLPPSSPGAVQQHPRSLEQVELSLEIGAH